MSSPAVCIIMPVYNAEQYVGLLLKVSQLQTWKDWELLIIDDGSSDWVWGSDRKISF